MAARYPFAPAKRANKYGARKTACAHGHRHDSKREAVRCNELHLLQRAGQIRGLEVQPVYWFSIDGRALVHENGRRVGVTLDFRYFEGDTTVCEDAKPPAHRARGRDWPLRKAVFRALYPYVELREV